MTYDQTEYITTDISIGDLIGNVYSNVKIVTLVLKVNELVCVM